MKNVTIKTAFTSCILVILSTVGHAQITLSGGELLTNPHGMVVDMIKVEGLTSPGGLSSIANNDKIRTYKYIDGFGRPLQDIIEKGSPNGKDLIQLYKYDEFGRLTKQYLPFEYTSVSSGSPYQDRSTAITNQASFYSTGTTANKIAADSKPWSESDIEQSPMQRLLKQGSVGDGFQTNQHYKSMVYRVNESGDAVRKWASDGTSSGTYSANDLNVTEGIDENNVKTMVFTDKLGRTVLKRQQADETINSTNYPFFDTYFVYDILGNLAFVVPPKAVVKLTSTGGTWNAASTVPELIFTYKYDTKNRVTEKKVPGNAVVYMVYDPLDRVVLVQSGTMRSNNQWFYSKYDASGRVVIEGVYTNSTYTTLSGMQGFVNGQSCYGSSSTTYYEVRDAFSSSLYTNNCFPASNIEDRLYQYYDDYDFNLNGSPDYGYSSQSLPGEGSATDKVLGMPVMSSKKVLGTSTWLSSISFYDKRYNLIQVSAATSMGGSTVGSILFTNVIDYGGRLTEKKEYYKFSKTSTLTIRNSYTYDKMNRLTEVKQGHNGGTMIIVSRYEYNSLGQLVDKKLHSTNSGSTFLQSVDFRYNIRGQLKSINNSTLSSDAGVSNDESNDVWGMNLLYEQEETGSNQIGNSANWTGMLSAVKWKANISGGNNDERAYLFSYDKLYRLTSAAYKAYNTGSSNWTKDPNGFNETIGYDWNGNILTMKRKSVISGSVTDIDDMVYDYGSSNDNNKLVNMTENSSNSYGYRNFTSSSSGYTYDVNGNLTADAKKGTTITYNEYNKPRTITQTSTGKYVQFDYDAAGIRISKTVYDGSTTTTEVYMAGVVVSSSAVLKHFAMAEGRVRNNSGTLVYEYFITDHQGNVRVSFEDNGSGTAVARQENSYYPYGMLMAGNYMPSDPNKRLYNAGSQWQDEFSGIVDYYSTFFREYDPVIGRFNGVDSKAEITMELSVYHYSGNNPINLNDPMGDTFGGEHNDFREGLDFGRYRHDWGGRYGGDAYSFIRLIMEYLRGGNRIDDMGFTSSGYSWKFNDGYLTGIGWTTGHESTTDDNNRVIHRYIWQYKFVFSFGVNSYSINFRMSQEFTYAINEQGDKVQIGDEAYWKLLTEAPDPDGTAKGLAGATPYIADESGYVIGSAAGLQWDGHNFMDYSSSGILELYFKGDIYVNGAGPGSIKSSLYVTFSYNFKDINLGSASVIIQDRSFGKTYNRDARFGFDPRESCAEFPSPLVSPCTTIYMSPRIRESFQILPDPYRRRR